MDRPGDPSQRSFADTELNDVQIKLERAGNFKPAQVSLAFTLAKQKTKAAYNFEAKIWGDESKPWWERKCHFDLATKRFTAQNWQTITSLASVDSKNPAYSNFVSKLTSTLPKFVSSSVNASQVFIPTSGEFDFHAIASGIPSQKTDADLQLKADNLIIRAKDNTNIRLPATAINTKVTFMPDSFAWNKCIIDIPDYSLHINSSGLSTIDSEGKPKSNQYSVVGLFSDLRKLSSLISFAYSKYAGRY